MTQTDRSEEIPKTLSAGEKHLLVLIRRGAMQSTRTHGGAGIGCGDSCDLRQERKMTSEPPNPSREQLLLCVGYFDGMSDRKDIASDDRRFLRMGSKWMKSQLIHEQPGTITKEDE